MPLLLRSILVLMSLIVMSGCTATEPAWRAKTQQLVLQLEGDEAPQLLPDAFHSMLETFQRGEAIYREQEDGRQADRLYLLALQKGTLLKDDLARHRAQQAEIARLKAEAERVQQEELKRKQVAAEEQQRKEQAAAQERAAARKEAVTRQSVQESNGSGVVRDRPLSYSVRRGETLPQIAARPEIYNEPGLWPLIYRANRDQVRDPYQLWPGQVLKIPRSYSRDEANEARRQAARR